MTAALVDLESMLVIAAAAGELEAVVTAALGALEVTLVIAATAGERIGSGDCSSGGFGVCAGDSSGIGRADRQW